MPLLELGSVSRVISGRHLKATSHWSHDCTSRRYQNLDNQYCVLGNEAGWDLEEHRAFRMSRMRQAIVNTSLKAFREDIGSRMS